MTNTKTTVRELIKKLKTLPQNAEVFIYEKNYNACRIKNIESVEFEYISTIDDAFNPTAIINKFDGVIIR
jgi:hypothetical protein